MKPRDHRSKISLAIILLLLATASACSSDLEEARRSASPALPTALPMSTFTLRPRMGVPTETFSLPASTPTPTPALLFEPDVWAGYGPSVLKGIRVIEIDPLTPTTLYAGADSGGLFKSIDAGGSWRPLKTVVDVEDLAIDPLNPSILYAGTRGGGVFVLHQLKP